MPAKVNEEICAECGACVKACPVNAISLCAAEAGPTEKKDPQGRVERAPRPHAHGHERHKSRSVERIRTNPLRGRDHVHRGR